MMSRYLQFDLSSITAHMPQLSGLFYAIVPYAVVVGSAYYTFLAIYRLYFHPLASFPGPWMAAVTDMYAAYYDVVKGGEFVKHLPDLHRKYGPIVRILPDQLHVDDIDSYNETLLTANQADPKNRVFKIGTKYTKDPSFLPFAGSLFAILDVPTAKKRKDAYTPYFSRSAIRKIEPLIHTIVARWTKQLHQYAESGRAVDISRASRCLTLDVITQYCFSQEVNAVQAEGFQVGFLEALDKTHASMNVAKYFPWFLSLMERSVGSLMPRWMQDVCFPGAASFTHFVIDCQNHMRSLASKPRPEDAYPTVFDNLINPSEDGNTKAKPALTDEQLTTEAVLLIGAGMDTTATALVVAVYNLTTHPSALETLQRELKQALQSPQPSPRPDPPNGNPETGSGLQSLVPLSLDQVEHLPYLTAVLKESLRLSYGVPGPISRIVPPGGATIAGRKVPAGAAVSHSAFLYHTDASAFPEPGVWRPERWIEADPNQEHEMKRAWMPFSRGSRQCLGMNLAWAELYLAIANLLTQFDIENAGTTEQDMQWRDRLITVPDGHLRVLLRAKSV